jgi:hypothetical protein
MLRRIDKHEMVLKTGVSLDKFQKHVFRQSPTALLEGMPDPVCRQPKMLWLESDVDAWLMSQSTLSPAPAPTHSANAPAPEKRGRGRGRPRRISEGGEG